MMTRSDRENLACAAAYDSATGSFTIPPRTTAVFVENSGKEEDD
jgi:pullulanase